MHEKRTFIVMFVAIFVAMLGVGVIAPTMPIYARTLGANGLWLGIIYGTFSISRMIFMPVAGRLSDIKGRKGFLVMGLTIYALASFGYIWSQTVIQITWIRLLHGIGSAMVIPIATAVIGDISPRGKEGSVMGSFLVALFLGFGAGPLLGGVVMDSFGINAVFYIMGAMSFIALLLIVSFLPQRTDQAVGAKEKVSSVHEIFREDRFKGIFIFRFSNAAGRAALIAFIPIFADQMNITPAQIGLLISIHIFVTGLLQWFFGKLADRFSKTWFMVIGNLFGTLPLLLTPLATSLTHLLILGILMGVGSALAFPAAGAVATEIGREYGMGNIMGYFNMAMSLGMITGAIGTGIVMDLFGLSYVFLLGGIIGITGTLLCLFWLKRGSDRVAL